MPKSRGLDVLINDDDSVTLGRGRDVRVAFQLAPDHRPPQWPDPAHPQQFHLDIFVADLDKAQQEVEALGARSLHAGDGYRVYADPAGHPFCLCVDNPAAP
jgi:Glyoxalase-like domain